MLKSTVNYRLVINCEHDAANKMRTIGKVTEVAIGSL